MEITKASHSIIPVKQPTKKEVIGGLRNRNRNFMGKLEQMYPVPELADVFDVTNFVFDPKTGEETQRYQLVKKIAAACRNKGYSARVAKDAGDRYASDVLNQAKAAALMPKAEIPLEVISDEIKPKKRVSTTNDDEVPLVVVSDEIKPKIEEEAAEKPKKTRRKK